MKQKPICTGTGLVALDVILNGSPLTPPKFHVGGSCGNVLTILSYLGWESFPIARFANNGATKEVEKDLKKWGVKTKLITKSEDGRTPIIIHRILKDKDGNPKHRFEFIDPTTHKWLPEYKPVLSKNVDEIVSQQPTPKVFYFDRINRASIELAKINKELGALIFFEPSSMGSQRNLFEECLDIVDILKFSSDRIKNYSTLYPEQRVALEIETLGRNGLKYRYSQNKKSNVWHDIEAFHSIAVIDAAGAGDWCSAGIINQLGHTQKIAFHSATPDNIKDALMFGQALGALNCCFEGARGIMYSHIKSDAINKFVRKIKTGVDVKTILEPKRKLHQRHGALVSIASLYE